jgi:tetratricopeptide (TPR) repeat protein
MKKYYLFSLILSFTILMSVSAQNAKKFYKVGEEFFENGKFEDAIDQFSKAIDVDPDYEDAYIMRATVYEEIKDPQSAKEDYERLAIFDDKNEMYFYNGARMNYELGEYMDALLKLNKTLEVKRIFMEALQLKVLTLMELKKYDDALEAAKDALRLKETDVNFYNYGRVNEMVGLWDQAQEAYENAIKKNREYYEAYVHLADLQRRRDNLQIALVNANRVLTMDKNYMPAYRVRSAIYADQLNYSAAINDVSTILLVQPENAEMYFLRGNYYQSFAQHQNAVSDFGKVITLQPDHVEAYFNRAHSYEQLLQYDNAIKDYKKLMIIAEDDDKAKELLAQSEKRLFELNRENDNPEITLTSPVEQEDKVIFVPRNETVISLGGIVEDESSINKVIVNGHSTPFTQKEGKFEFLTSVNVDGISSLNVEVSDIYNNLASINYKIIRTEVIPPTVRVLAPYASDNNVIYLESDDPTIYVEGEIEDESLIKSIYIDDVIASYIPDDKNPGFSAMINIQNKDRFVVSATDAFGNVSRTTFSINRESAELLGDNPMGKTWVVFIENSNYETFASLEGPVRDVSLMKTALAKYSIHNFIHKKDLTKQEMEKFFAIELRDLLKSNHVNSVLIWYAGHGKLLGNVGYWVPVDAKRDDEFTYYSLNALQGSLKTYPESVSHTLLITDACESGPSFYQAMRSELKARSCNDYNTVRLKSSQVFSSAGYELAVDNSQFTRTFARVLATNQDACIPIENIAIQVTNAVMNNNKQKPQFGNIEGLEHEDGTFFFITK